MKSVKRTEQQLILTFLPISAWLSCVISLIGGFFLPYPWCLVWYIPSTIINVFILFFADSVNCYFDQAKNQLIQQKLGIRGRRIKKIPLSEISGVYLEKLRIKKDYIYLIYFSLNSEKKFYLIRWNYANFREMHSSVNSICEFLKLPPYQLIDR
ncbi:hypothetical protein PCC7424_2561 [Gloeothece citriformis PCC 7424]|uniref:Lipoprotein n=1 Tax=Gloeothece citriformis (strain PCC 7424) TaxID=65393 RepID=B7KK92_GLOC7|nr:hypothetical protein [Gloeothece citriformis]ACK70977.1 hypothetical protein PCC7424_2561 [Gloeothece citriformis PCC 7424]